MKRYSVALTGVSALLMHYDNIQWADMMKKWGMDPANKKSSVAGDDRSPAFRWIGCLYHEGERVVIPSDNLMTVLREGGKRCPTGKRQGTFKAQTQSGILVDQIAWPLLVNGKEIPFTPFRALADANESDFEVHEQAAKANGFELFVKRAVIGASKHVRVRPRFDNWSCGGTITVVDETLTRDVLTNILTFAGAFAGIGDWRPSAPKGPGPFGRFTAEIKAV